MGCTRNFDIAVAIRSTKRFSLRSTMLAKSAILGWASSCNLAGWRSVDIRRSPIECSNSSSLRRRPAMSSDSGSAGMIQSPKLAPESSSIQPQPALRVKSKSLLCGLETWEPLLARYNGWRLRKQKTARRRSLYSRFALDQAANAALLRRR